MRIDVDQSAVLSSLVTAIRNGVTMPDGQSLEDKDCYLSFYEEPYKFGGQIIITVNPGPSRFPEGFQIGGGAKQCMEELDVSINIWSRHPPNQLGHDSTGLIDAARGIYQVKSRILRALCAVDLAANYPPGTQGVQQFLRELLLITGCSQPEHMGIKGENNTYSKLTVSIRLSWDWDLTS
jgi:hypothetical protein